MYLFKYQQNTPHVETRFIASLIRRVFKFCRLRKTRGHAPLSLIFCRLYVRTRFIASSFRLRVFDKGACPLVIVEPCLC